MERLLTGIPFQLELSFVKKVANFRSADLSRSGPLRIRFFDADLPKFSDTFIE